jgi:hypothetical protein
MALSIDLGRGSYYTIVQHWSGHVMCEIPARRQENRRDQTVPTTPDLGLRLDQVPAERRKGLRIQPAGIVRVRPKCRCLAAWAGTHANCQEGGHLRDGYETRHGSGSPPFIRASSGRCGRDSSRLAGYHATQAVDDNRAMLPQTECGRSGSEDGEHTWVRGCQPYPTFRRG